MDLRGVITKTFNDTIKRVDINSELKASLKEHPKTKQLLDNLHMELLKVDVLRRSQGKKSLKEQTIADTVRDFTYKFITGVEGEANKRIESDLKRLAREAELQKQKDLEATANGNVSGEYKELEEEGLKIGTTTEHSV